jgi:zinc/manganese transport system permease protein
VGNALSLDIITPAFVAGLLVLATHVPLGGMVLARGIVFIDIAIAQVAALGVVVGAAIVGELSFLIVQASAFAAAILCSAFLIWSEKRFPEVQEAIIGVAFVLAAAAQIIVLSANPGGAEHLKELLVGQILLVGPGELVVMAVAYAGVLAVWAFRDLSTERLLFYGVFAVVITLSVQIVGVLLVFASLIVPALAARAVPEKWRLLVAFNVGTLGYALGLITSALYDVPTGASIVCAIVAVAIVSAALSGSVFRTTALAVEPTVEAPTTEQTARAEIVPLRRDPPARPATETGDETPRRQSV